jgi:DNA polymerase-1
MARKKVLLVDGEAILHQSFHKFEKLKSTDGKPSGAIFGFFKSLHMYIERFNPNDVYITFDNGHSPLRDKLLPDYKGHRKNISYDRESMIKQKVIILKILRYLRIKYLFDKDKLSGYEGDDLLAYLYFKVINPECLVTIVSPDKDFNQLLINDRVKIFNPRKEEYVRQTNCKELFGYTPYETVDYLSLVGDSSDDIPGVPGIGPVKARKLLDKYGSISNYIKTNPEISDTVIDIVRRNHQLIDLKWFISNNSPEGFNNILKTYTRGKINYEKFKEVCIEYSFNSFMTDIFIEPFKKLLK